MEAPFDLQDVEMYSHRRAHREFNVLVAAFETLATESSYELTESWCESDHLVRRRIGEIRRDLRYSSHDSEAWAIVKYRVISKMLELHAAYLKAQSLHYQTRRKQATGEGAEAL